MSVRLRCCISALLCGLAWLSGCETARADVLEVREPAYIYQAPNKRSPQVYAISMKDRTGPVLLTMLDDRKTNGYYLVRLPGKHNETGWVYKSYVRRFAGAHPAYVSYNRKLYRHWVDEDHDCQDTRQEVLIRDSKSKTLFADTSDCRVSSGQWTDPYSGQSFDDPRLLDVDHFVPLKNAHESGAWTWSPEKKMRYANYLSSERHLLAVSASENRKKGDKGPDRYMPPDSSYACDYVRTWIAIKAEWELEMTEQEGATVDEILEGCP